jgi:hypothetical protein
LPYPFFIGSELLLLRGIYSSSSVSTSFSINLAASYSWFSEEKTKSPLKILSILLQMRLEK